MMMSVRKFSLGLLSLGIVVGGLHVTSPETVRAHGDVTPQAVDTAGLPALGEEWLEENPWRDPDGEHWARAVEVGASGYNQNCARCHGLGGVSGGLAPDLRYLEADLDGDEWYLERYRVGYTQNGITKMPAFGDLLGQEAAWAIRTYIETRPDGDALDAHTARLQEIRDILNGLVDAGTSAADAEATVAPLKEEMGAIAKKIETGSGAPLADSPASQAFALLDGSDAGLKGAAEVLTIGLSAAK